MPNVIFGTVMMIMLLAGAAGAPAQDASYPRCEDAKEAGKAKSPGMWKVPCWLEVSNQPKCDVLILQSNTRKVAWDGACVSNAAHGTGTFRRMPHRFSEYMTEESGEMVSGKRHGPWVVMSRVVAGTRRPGEVAEGSYVDGLAQGHWAHRWNDGKTPRVSGGRSEGPMVDGRRHGPWVTRWDNGDIVQGSYVNGKEQGLWVEKYPSMKVEHESPYVDGKLHGVRVTRIFGADSGTRTYRSRWMHGKFQGKVK